MGRPPKPAALKARLGNPGQRPLPASAATLTPAGGAVPDVPRGLRKGGKAAWARLWQVGAGWLSVEADYALLQRLCEAYDERAQLRQEIRKAGRTVPGSRGQLVTNPLVEQLRAVEELMTRWESLCGFTPADRSRLGLTELQRVSKLQEFLGEHGFHRVG